MILLLRRLPVILLLPSLAAVAADLLLAGASPGWTWGLCLGLLALLVLARDPRLLQRTPGRVLAAVCLLAAGSCLVEVGWLATVLALGATVALAVEGRGGGAPGVWGRCTQAWSVAWAAPARLLRDHLVVMGWWLRAPVRALPARWASLLLRWVVPLLVGGVFLAIFTGANPVLAWCRDLVVETLERWLDHLDLPVWWRPLLWLGAGLLAWGAVRLRARRPDGGAWVQAPPVDDAERAPLVVRCLVVVNLVFLLQLGLDGCFLVGRMALPQGMGFAEYAHRGAYPLLAGALLAAGMVLALVRPGRPLERHPWVRRLVGLWLLQNVVLTAAALWRLALYIEAYGLTRWRLAAGVWMLLVATGLLLIAWRIARACSNRWLVDANAAVLLTVLLLVSWWDADGTIARVNVARAPEMGGPALVPLDLDYLVSLGVPALPALRRLAREARDPAFRREVGEQVLELQAANTVDLGDWRSWTWVRARAQAEARIPLRLQPGG
jgi:hypothetical protein